MLSTRYLLHKNTNFESIESAVLDVDKQKYYIDDVWTDALKVDSVDEVSENGVDVMEGDTEGEAKVTANLENSRYTCLDIHREIYTY